MANEHDTEEYPRITITTDTENPAAAHIAAALSADIAAAFGPRRERPLSVAAHHGETLAGGLNAATHWGWCYIRHLWVHPAWRRRGLALRLLAETETQARAQACAGLYVDTFDPAAVALYQRAGFTQAGRIENFPPGHTRTFLHKPLP